MNMLILALAVLACSIAICGANWGSSDVTWQLRGVVRDAELGSGGRAEGNGVV